MSSKNIIVVGGGLGGLSAAIRLRADGHMVTVLEKNERAGGKLNIRAGKGYTFDTGPSILTMPWVLEQLFASAGRSLSDYLKLSRIEPQWRTFFEDGVQIDLDGDLPQLLAKVGELSRHDRERLLPYLEHARKLYDLSIKSFYKSSLSGRTDLRHHHSLKELLAMDPLKTVAQTTANYFDSPHLRQLLNFLVMYVGSSPYSAPAILTQLAYVQLGLGIFYVEGGMYNIARAMLKLLEELSVEVRTNAEVSSIVVENGQAAGVRLANGDLMLADIIVCNKEVIPAYSSLLGDYAPAAAAQKKLAKFVPSVSGHVLLLGVNRTFPNMKHHNFFMSKDPEREFHRIFVERLPAEDPTVYVGISSKTDSQQAPDGKENWFVLTHVPALQGEESWIYRREYYRELVLEKLERMGATGLRSAIEFEYDFVPDDLQALYGSNGGSIYGVVSNRKLNGGFKIASRSTVVDKLYFVGGSVHPGGGVPMVTLSGQLTADLIRLDLASQAVM
ncbi:diapolycopene oxygenase [Paenibacillus baekrokdamisoli]|uniref:4,4'-diaponeurosporene oxygenase n=1 Tax=Paenibacillus baekrokdamisoli TaxID=1712516 RepID=A0A3G9INS2_9BACL|nr:phytoene desaturase family protein [Paenibacillus baekrokdamisoli]MBB3070625.1 diapolycopene oxygenase [Paenibacillus baekrokdamisoli]BBH19976.1 diapolycopene oxygenase [Paenibacillus baekrokdamisoli]